VTSNSIIGDASGRRPRWMAWLAAVALALLTARLGWWQLDRASQKQARQAQLIAQAQAEPLRKLADWPRDATDWRAQHYRSVEIEGRWAAAGTLYLDNRPMAGRPGFLVVTPLLLADGTAVLVQRGWTPRDARDRTRLQVVTTPEDSTVSLSARLAPWPSRTVDLGAEVPGAIRQNIDIEEQATAWRLRLREGSLQQLAPAHRLSPVDALVDDGLLRHWPLPAADVHKHYGYAAQWFSMAALTVGLSAWFGWWRPRRKRLSLPSA
jgi:surfeit locus 1 family protein